MMHSFTKIPARSGGGFEPATNETRTIVLVGAAMLTVLFMLLGVAYLIYRYTPPAAAPAPPASDPR